MSMKYLIDIDGPLGDWYVSKRSVKAILAKHSNEHVDARINSPGGSLDHGLDIAQQFVDHGDVTAYIYGLTASASTIAASGAKKIVMSSNAMVLFHRVSNWVDVWGQMNEEEIDRTIAELIANKEDNKKMDLMLARMYANRCKKTIEDMHAIMVKSAWLTADEAKEIGFVDEILENKEPVMFTNSMADKFNSMQMPIPPIEFTAEEVSEKEARNLWERFLAFISNDKKDSNSNIINQPENSMRKLLNFLALNALLAVEGIDFSDEAKTAALTEDQLKAINEKLDTLQTAIDAKDAEIALNATEIQAKANDIVAKDAEIATLKLAAGDDDTRHHSDDDDTEDSGDVVKNARAMFNQFKEI